MLVVLVLVLRVALQFIQFVEAKRVGMGVMTMVIVDQDRLNRKGAQHERRHDAQCCGTVSGPPDRTNRYVCTASAH